MLRFFCCGAKNVEKQEKNTTPKPNPQAVPLAEEKQATPVENKTIQTAHQPVDNRFNTATRVALHKDDEDRIRKNTNYAVLQARTDFLKMDPVTQATVAHKIAAKKRINELPTDIALAVTQTKYAIPANAQRTRANCVIKP